MNRLTIIGNLTRDPETRTMNDGNTVCSFTVAVNRRTGKDHPEADYFRVSAWRQLGETCAKYLAKGRKVAVVGSVRASAYTDQSGNAKGSLEVTATDVEFLSPKGQETMQEAPAQVDPQSGMEQVTADDDLPF